ncbi:MAG: phosphopantetheine-binding protein [Candidatus Lernaella stagnicola]|nr:phosphopantetheine-binding protein [Candidatus Lernaella stagnicola]
MRLQDRLRAIIAEQIKPDDDLPNFADDEDMFVLGVLSSLEILDLVVSLEDTFGIKVPHFEVVEQNFNSLDAMAAYLEGKGVSG